MTGLDHFASEYRSWQSTRHDLHERDGKDVTPDEWAASDDAAVEPGRTPVLDVTCGTRAMWFDKLDPRAIMCDQRAEAITVTDRSHGRQDGTRTLTIDPDIQCDFRELPFPDATFRLVVFDPPHLVRAGRRSWLAARYGRLGDSWRDDLRQGFAECFRVLMPGGVLIFKWSEVQVPLRDVLALTPERPLFGHPTGKSTHWVAFIAPEAPETAAEVLSLPPVRWHTDPRTCPHANEHACPTCDHDGYYANTYPDCPWKEQ